MTTLEGLQIKEMVVTYQDVIKEYRKLTAELLAKIRQLKADNEALKKGPP